MKLRLCQLKSSRFDNELECIDKQEIKMAFKLRLKLILFTLIAKPIRR